MSGWQMLAASLFLAAAAHAWRWSAARVRGRSVRWFQMLPSGAEVQWGDFRHAVGSVRHAVMSGRVLIARLGSDHNTTSIWVGVAGTKHPAQVAQLMARAAGAQIGEESAPDIPSMHGLRWRLGYTDSAPGRREKDATEVYLRALDERTIPEHATFPAACSDYLMPGDAFVAVVQPTNAPTRMRAMCLTTAVGLDMSFSDAAEIKRSFLRPSAALAVVPLVVAACAVVAFGDPMQEGSQPPGWLSSLAMAAVAVWGSAFAWSSIRSPAALSALAAGRAPRFPRRARKGKLLPVWQMGEWAAGDDRSGTAAPMMPAPPQALSAHGALIGSDPLGKECRLPDELRYRGTMTYGDPGGGKTTFLLNLLAHDAARRARGEHVSIVWIETKGEGAERAARVMQDHGAEPLMLIGSAPSGPRLELVDRSKPAESARLLTEAIRYSFEADDIHQASADVLAAALEAAIACPPEAARNIGVKCDHLPNLIPLAFHILGGVPETFGPTKRILRKEVHEQHRQAVERFFSRRDFDYERMVEPARNKLKDLFAVAGLFEPGSRQQTTWSSLLTAAQPTVLNLGRSAFADDDPAGSAYTDLTAQRAAAIAMFMLWHTIQSECDGWQASGRSVAIYSDELRDISGWGKHGLEIVQAMADQGRSRGVIAAFGTQRPDQLVPSTRAAVDSFATQAIFKLRAPIAAITASEQLFGAFTPEQITALPRGYCALSIAADGRTPAAFTLHPKNL